LSPVPTHARDRLLALLAALRPCLGTLLAVPVVVLLFGSQWTWERTVLPVHTWRVSPGTASPDPSEEVRLHFFEDGADPGRGIELGDDSAILAELPRSVSRFVIVLQADLDDRFLVLGGSAPGHLEPLWQVPRDKKGEVLQTRRSPVVDLDHRVRFLEVRSLRGFGGRSVSGLRLELEPLAIPHVWLIPVLWGAWALLRLARRWLPGADRVLGWWRDADLWLAAALIVTMMFRVPEAVVFVALALAGTWAALRLVSTWLTRAPGSLALTVVVLSLLAVAVPRLFRAALTARIAELHELTVDHRPRPGSVNGEINEDRIRFHGVASDLADEDFVVVFLGDSFTHGVNLAYEDTYPSVFERVASGLDCSAPVRAVNAGWTSASPLLALRLAREIGPRYRPDLVVYNLDMTDFHDDLLYEARLREGGDLDVDAGRAFLQLLDRAFPAVARHRPRLERARGLLRTGAGDESTDDGPPLPADRFFATSRPLERSVADIERGVVRNLVALDDLSRDVLGARFAVIVYPRAYQYSLRESPDSWEQNEYEVMGPWVREPFRYFEKKARRLPFPVLSALPAFEESEVFPLFQADDPHWNEAGARLMAQTAVEWAAGSGLIPCLVPGAASPGSPPTRSPSKASP